jgi:hypothetical protein
MHIVRQAKPLNKRIMTGRTKFGAILDETNLIDEIDET